MNYFEAGHTREVITIVCTNGGVNPVTLCVTGAAAHDGSPDTRMLGLQSCVVEKRRLQQGA